MENSSCLAICIAAWNDLAFFILLNSFLHHIDDDNTDAILTRLHDILDPDALFGADFDYVIGGAPEQIKH